VTCAANPAIEGGPPQHHVEPAPFHLPPKSDAALAAEKRKWVRKGKVGRAGGWWAPEVGRALIGKDFLHRLSFFFVIFFFGGERPCAAIFTAPVVRKNLAQGVDGTGRRRGGFVAQESPSTCRGRNPR